MENKTEKLRNKIEQLEARLKAQEARERRERKKKEDRLTFILGRSLLAKGSAAEISALAQSFPEKDRSWVKRNFPEILERGQNDK